MQEIEVKANVTNLPLVLKKLTALGCILSKPIRQVDRIFIQDGVTIPVPIGHIALRIREQEGKYYFTLKQPVSGELDCIEKETTISDPDEVAAMCELMGYPESLGVTKLRRKCQYKEYEICVDEVENLGTFIEVEKKVEDTESNRSTDDEDGQEVQEELFTFLQQLGVAETDRVHHGYDILLYLKQNGE